MGAATPEVHGPRRRVWLRAVLAVCAVLLLVASALTLWFYRDPLWFADRVVRLHLWRQGVRGGYVEVSGNRLHYLEAAPAHGGAGTPLVLVHGLGARAEDWAGMIPTLAACGFHVYALDLPGYGRSSRPAVPYTIGYEEEAVEGFAAAMGLARASYAGWSMGGWIVLKLAIDHPERVDRLALYDAAGLYFPPTYGGGLFSPATPAELWTLQQHLSPQPKPLPGFVARAALRRLAENAGPIQSSVEAMLGGRELLDFRLGAVRAPTLIVWGAQDTLVPPAVGERMHRGIAGSSLVLVAGCGHLAPAECSRPVLQATLGFLTAQPPPSGGERTVPGH